MDVDWVASAIARARDLGADAIAEQAFEILDMPPAYKTTEGGQSIDQGDVANRKLQVEGRLKLLAKWNPKKYGDRTVVAGDDEAPVVIEASFDVFGELLKNIAMTRQASE